MYARWHVPSASATPWDGADDSSLAPAQRLVMGWQREQYERLHELGGGLDAAFLNAYERESCAWCDSDHIVMFGSDRRGVRRWRCGTCGRTFTPATGTIFEDRKLPVVAWVEFLLGIMSYESLAGIARRDRRSPTTPSLSSMRAPHSFSISWVTREMTPSPPAKNSMRSRIFA